MTGGSSWTRSPVVAGILGVFAGGLSIFLLEAAGHAVTGTADLTDFTSITTPMFVSVLVAWVVGSGVAGAMATYWAQSSSIALGVVVGLVLLAAAVSNMIAIPHPVWMVVSAVLLMPMAAIFGARGFMRMTSE